MVTVKSIPSLTEDAVKKSSVLIYTDGSRDELLKWNAFCRANKVAFMAGDVLGCFGYMFTDFNEHLVRDSNGENPNVRVITNISNDEQGVVTVLTPPEPGARRYGIEENDHDGFIELDDVDGMVDSDGKSINDYGPFKIKSMYNTYKKKDGKEGKRFNAYQFEIGDTSKFSKYEGGGVMTQKKIPFKREFKDLKESLRNPIGKGNMVFYLRMVANLVVGNNCILLCKVYGNFNPRTIVYLCRDMKTMQKNAYAMQKNIMKHVKKMRVPWQLKKSMKRS